MRNNIRKEQQLKRKNFLPTLIISMVLWALLGGIVYFVDPDTFGALPIFFVLLFLSFLFMFSLLFASTRRGLITSISLSLFSILLYLGVGNILNLVLILAIAICVELYLAR